MADGFGLDKTSRLQAKREDALTADKPEPLNPPFPYVAEPFDPLFFSLPANPEPVDED
jgi:hypothetical protein